MIIVEGPDGAGKSTLVHSLAKDLRLQVGQRSTKERSEIWRTTRPDTLNALGAAVAGEPIRIWDRMFFSEMVYHRYMGRPCEFTEPQQVFIRRIMQVLAVPIIVCYPPLDTVRANIEGSDQMKGVAENIDEIYLHYGSGDIFGHITWLLWYDYTNQKEGGSHYTYDELVTRCQHYINRRSERT